jgi:plastocyanin
LVPAFLAAASLVLAHPSCAANVAGTVTIDGRRATNAVVYLEQAGDAAPPASPSHAVMDQRNLEFVPRVLPVVRGTTIEFTNSDDIQHNVFSPSAAAGKFDLGTYGPGGDRRITLDEPGEVRVLCNIHMEMEARILVLRDPYFSPTADDGAYRITSVPAGAYTVKVWQDGFLSGTRATDVPADGDLTLDLQINR